MAGEGRKMGGLVLCVLGILGVSLTCGLPMWRETSFVGANVVTAQSVWDGLWLHCVVQSTGQMQCKRHMSTSLTVDMQAGRALTLVSIVAGFLGFMVGLLGGGVVNCSEETPDPNQPQTNPTSKEACILGGALCVLSGVLCLVSVIWSAVITNSVYNDQLVVAALKRDVGSSIYIGLVSSVLLLLGGVLIGFVCWDKDTQPPPSNYSYLTYTESSGTQRSSTITTNSSGTNPNPKRTSHNVYQVYSPESVYGQVQQSYAPQYTTPYSVNRALYL